MYTRRGNVQHVEIPRSPVRFVARSEQIPGGYPLIRETDGANENRIAFSAKKVEPGARLATDVCV